MAYITHGRGSGLSYGKYIPLRIFSAITVAFENVQRRLRLRKTAKQLLALEPHMLNDIGIARDDVTSMADLGDEQAIWRLNAARKRASRNA
jgi:uncharacterized protein YjiS (DUF1127 family)